MRRLFRFLFFIALVTAGRAQSVHWENSDSGDPSDVQLVFQDCVPDGDPQIPRIDGTTLTLTGTSSQTTINNFNFSRSTILSYRARTQRSGALQIPVFAVQTNKGSIRVPAFTGGVPRTAADANVVSHLNPGATTVWAGEVFPLTYVLDVARRSFNQLGTNIEWSASPLVIEDWSKFEPGETISNGEARLNIISKTRAYAKTPGIVTLNAANQLVNLQTGSVGFGLFQTPRIEQVSVPSDRPTLNVRPLPTPAPAGFNGAVGQFKLTSKIVPTAAAAGEPVTWTLELSGTGNWPDIAGLPQREVSKDFNVVQPKAKRTPAEGKLFDVTVSEDVVLVPTRAGSYALGPVNFVYFDPSSGSYQTITTPKTTVTISAPAAPQIAPQTPSADNAGATPASRESAAESKIENLKSKIPASPIGIPRDPLPGSDIALVPLSNRTLFTFVLLPFALLPLLWAWLAIRRAQQTDPLRPQREARQRLAVTLTHLRAPQPSTLNSQLEQQQWWLLQWQHDSAVLWQIPHAAPAATAFKVGTALRAVRSAPSAGAADPARAAWTALWLESDRALYSADAKLPADWTTRAETALAAKRVPGFQPFAAFLPRNLLPFVAVIALLLVLAPFARADETKNAEPKTQTAVSAAPDPAAAYRRGEFPAAELTWRATLAKSPTDAIARHNLSLVLAQQDRWGESAAHAAAAFVQQPSNPSIRWHLALASNKAGYAPASLAAFLPPGPVQSLAGQASPGVWQITLIAAAGLIAAALATLLFGAYRRPSRLRSWSASVILGAAALLSLSAVASLHAYGGTADRRAVIVWRAGTLRSIPTEADTTQKTTALSAGSLAIGEKTFLGWIRLRFENGQTGWVRQEDVIALWR